MQAFKAGQTNNIQANSKIKMEQTDFDAHIHTAITSGNIGSFILDNWTDEQVNIIIIVVVVIVVVIVIDVIVVVDYHEYMSSSKSLYAESSCIFQAKNVSHF
ncbi:hypothetical protein ACF0H5_007591 [Mactra antiquata]